MTGRRSVRYCHICGARLARDNHLTQCTPCQKNAGDLSSGPPAALPADFWTAGPMAEALGSWHIGQVIRAYRHHRLHGLRPLSQEVVAGWLGLTQTQLSRVESGPPVKDLGKLIAWARVLKIPAQLLWFKLPMADASGSVPHPRRAPTMDVIASGMAVSASTMTAALDDARRAFGGSVVDYFRQQLHRAKTDDGTFGPARALPLVLGILGAIAQHARNVTPDVRLRLLALGADGAEFAGWLHRDLEDPASAAYWYDRAMEWAQAANDTAMQGYVLLKKSQMAYDQRDAHRVAMFADAAQYGPWRLPAKIRAEVTQQEALGMAMLGEPMIAVERKIGQARQLLADAPPDDQGGLSGAYFSTETLSLRCATCYTEAGRPARAAELFGEVISTGTLSRRDVGFFSARRATALALSGEPDEAAAVGLVSVQVAREAHSERTMRVLGEVVRTLEPWSSRPGPRSLREAVVA